jgi:hypothetical protein
LLNVFTGKTKNIYVSGVAIFILIFTLADGPKTKNNNICEREALEKIANSHENIVALDSCDCTVMDWRKNADFNNSQTNAELLKIWGVTKDKKLFFQK